jgi:sporulation protein YlmC with PRC-barrel domain
MPGHLEVGLSADQARAGQVVGADLFAADGQKLGEIKDLLIHRERSTVDLVVVDPGGALGRGGEERVFAWDSIHLEQERQPRYVIDLSATELRSGSVSRAEAQPGQGYFNYTKELFNREVQTRDGKAVGEVRDVLFQLNGGRINALIVEGEFGSPLSVGSQEKALRVVPWEEARPAAQGGDDPLAIALTAEQVKQAPVFVSKAPSGPPRPPDRKLHE